MYLHLRPFARQLQFGSLYKIWCKNKREAVKLLRDPTDHSSNQSLTCSHPESSHVLRDSESRVVLKTLPPDSCLIDYKRTYSSSEDSLLISGFTLLLASGLV